MGSVQQIRVKWNNHLTNFPKVFDSLLHKKDFVDVTLSCEGHTLKAHKLVLSACSPYFHTLFVENPCKHPIVIMRDFKYAEIEAVIEYMYKGEVNIVREGLREFLRTAQSLQVKGLADDNCDTNDEGGGDDDDRTMEINKERSKAESVPVPELPPPPPNIRTVSEQSQSQGSINRESYSHPAAKRPRLNEKPSHSPRSLPRSPAADSVPSPQQFMQQMHNVPFQAEVKTQSPDDSASEIIEPTIKLEVKQYDDSVYDEAQDSMVDESQDTEQIPESPESDTIVLGDDPEMDEEPDVMFAHDATSQDGGHDSLESTLMSALGNAGPSMSQQQGAEGTREYHNSKRRAVGHLWDYFKEVPAMEKNVLCYVCGKMVARSKMTATALTYQNSHLIRHLKRKHNEHFEQYKGINSEMLY